MDITTKITAKTIYEELIQKTISPVEDVYAIARYPYISLTELCGNLNSFEYRRIKEIEDLNIYYFLNTIRIVLGLGSSKETETFKKTVSKEPLRTAAILGNMETNPIEKFITFTTTATKILLSPQDGGNHFFCNPINVAIVGSMPRHFLKSRQEIGNIWYGKFVDIKLDLMARAYRIMNIENVFSVMLTSIAYSLYHYTSSRYSISNNKTEDENLHIVLKCFLEHINTIKENKL